MTGEGRKPGTAIHHAQKNRKELHMCLSPQEAFDALQTRRRTYYDRYSAVYCGDRAALERTGERDSFWRRPGKAKLHVPIAADIAAISAELLFGEEVRFQIDCGTGYGDPEEKTRRLNEIIALQNELSAESNRRDVGKCFEVLVEGFSKRSDADLMGRTSQNKACVFPAAGHHKGEYVTVRVLDSTPATLLCEVVE